MKTSTKISLTIAMVALVEPALSAQTIVGKWRYTDSTCEEMPVIIRPMSLTTNEIDCGFKDVERHGDVVTWRGQCGGEDIRRPWNAKVIARLVGSPLSIKINDSETGTLERCP